ncbi:hypothetical protein ACVQ8P_00510 [Dellaglioa sp. BT-FLS60]
MKKIISLLGILGVSILLLSACGNKTKPDYTTNKAESTLNNGTDINGKTVEFKVSEAVPNSAAGYNLQTGKHLNFVSDSNPKVKKGDTVTVKVKDAKSAFGSWMITYTDLSKK